MKTTRRASEHAKTLSLLRTVFVEILKPEAHLGVSMESKDASFRLKAGLLFADAHDGDVCALPSLQETL